MVMDIFLKTPWMPIPYGRPVRQLLGARGFDPASAVLQGNVPEERRWSVAMRAVVSGVLPMVRESPDEDHPFDSWLDCVDYEKVKNGGFAL